MVPQSRSHAVTQSAIVHGYSVAFALNSVMLLLAAFTCAIFVTVNKDDLPTMATAPAGI